MINNMRLGIKIGGGFAIVLILTVFVSYMGWNGMKNVVDRMEKSNAVEALVRGMLETRENGKSYIITGNTKFIDQVAEDILNLKKNAAEARDKFNDPVNQKQMEEASAGFEAYGKAFAGYAELILQEGQIQAEWKAVAEEYTKITDEVLANIIIPHQKAAVAANDIKKLAEWSALETSLHMDVVQQFLYLRTTAIHYDLKRTSAQWENVQKAMTAVYAGIERWKTLGQTETDIVAAAQKGAEGIKRYENAAQRLHAGIEKGEKANQEMLAAAANVQELCAKSNTDQRSKMDGEISATDTLIIASALMALIFGVIISSFITLAITRPVRKAVELADAVAQGDLSREIYITQKDEIGLLCSAMMKMVKNLRCMVAVAENIAQGDITVQVDVLSEKDALGHALKDMVAKLSQILAEINLSASNVASGSEQMSSTSQAMSQGATEQASSLEEISSSMNEIASQTRQNAENATHAKRLSGDAKALAEKGNEQMQLMVRAMREINESSQSISKIIKVIDEIAFQTNLLALNAAVEAARAGRHGKGFAVVAEEVRNLAARSAKAAKETSDMIEGSVRKVDDGTDIADKTAESLKEIVAASAKVTDLVAEIAAASNEQAQGVSQITTGLGQIDQVTQQNTAHAEESASAAEELSSQAMVLQQLIGTFKIDALLNARKQEVSQEHSARQGMLVSGKDRAGNGNKAHKAPWGTTTGNHMPEPIVALDDREFGKY